MFLKRQLQGFVTLTIRSQHGMTHLKTYNGSHYLKGTIFNQALQFPNRVALRDNIASYTYANLFANAHELSKDISKLLDNRTGERVLFLCPKDVNYVITLWAIWMSGQIAVPLSPLHPKNILLYYANDTNSKLIITTPEYVNLMESVSKNVHCTLHTIDNKLKLNAVRNMVVDLSNFNCKLPEEFYNKSNAMILYTSGTTGNPKGVVLSHTNINAQIVTLLDAWRWSMNDVLLHSLPLHHVHGIVNALLCPLYIGAKTILLEKFNANTVWSHLLGVTAKPDDRKVTIYMAVPTIYSKLIDEYEKVFAKDPKMSEYIKNTLKTKIRLMVSGSAPLPFPIYKKWLDLSGHKLLERYGMTEIGMCLSNEYESNREPGFVGVPLPGVRIRLVDESNTSVLECANINGTINFSKTIVENVTGELQVKSPGTFKEYFNRPHATQEEFTAGWFRTGDMCEYNYIKKKFKLLGRKSVDIIKSGGYKISALEIETKILANSKVNDAVVFGIPDEEWGEVIIAVVVIKKDVGTVIDFKIALTDWLNTQLPKYALPKTIKFVDNIPKNVMGKVNKKQLIKSLFP